MAFPFAALIGPIASLIDKLIPDPEARERAKLALMQAEGQQALAETNAQLSAILAEAGSQDPWTSRARPTFLYLIYLIIMLCFVGGVLGVWFPVQVARAAGGINNMLDAVPEALWTLFGVGYLGYTGARSIDKWNLRGQ